MTELEKKEFLKKMKKFALKGDYKSGSSIAKRILVKHPKEFVVQYQYAKLLGDWADELSPLKQQKLKQESIKILKKLIPRLRGEFSEYSFGVCVNYYYQSRAFLGLYKFGRRFKNRDLQKGLYAEALGACLYAEEINSKKWARKSIIAWKKYALKKEEYYFAHYIFAKALALDGDFSAAMKALRIAAKRSKRKIDDWEFADVLKMILVNQNEALVE